MPIRLVTAAALLGGGYLIARRMARRPAGRGVEQPPQKTQDPACLEGIFLNNALWAEPIRQQLAVHNINLLPSPNIDAEAQVMAFDMALALIPTTPSDEVSPARDNIIHAIVEVIAPTCDWDRPLPYAVGSRHMVVWDGVGRVHDLARALLVAQGDV